jgi:hypothetical protein
MCFTITDSVNMIIHVRANTQACTVSVFMPGLYSTINNFVHDYFGQGKQQQLLFTQIFKKFALFDTHAEV